MPLPLPLLLPLPLGTEKQPQECCIAAAAIQRRHPPIQAAPSHPLRAAAALLVSKRWHRVFLSEPVLWRQFSIDRHAPPQKLASDLALLRRVGGLVASLKVNKHGSEVLAAALSHVQPAALQDLEAYKPEPQQVAALPRFSRLTSLLLSYDFLSGAVAAAFLQLPQLHSLRLLCEHVAGEVPSALAGCTQLSRLAVEAGVFQQPQGLRQLTALRQLKALSLVVLNLDDLGATAVAEDANLYPPDPVLLPALESFNLYFESAPTDVGVQVRCCCQQLWWRDCQQPVSCLPSCNPARHYALLLHFPRD